MAPVTRTTDQGVEKVEQKAKITLYWLEKSRAQRILWLLEELKLDYELKTYKRENQFAPKELEKVHPLGKSPLITIESEAASKPLVLAESGPIIEYLIDHFGPHLIPQRYEDGKVGDVGGETESWLRYRYYMHFAEGSLMPLLLVAILLRALKEGSPFFIKPVTAMITAGVESAYLRPNFRRQFDFIESQLASSPGGGDYLCGSQLTGADFMMSFGLPAAMDRGGLSKENYPKLWAYTERIEATDSFKRSVQKIIDVEGSYDARL